MDALSHELALGERPSPGHTVGTITRHFTQPLSKSTDLSRRPVVVDEALLLAVVELVAVAVVGLVAVGGGALLGRLAQVVLDHLSLHVPATFQFLHSKLKTQSLLFVVIENLFVIGTHYEMSLRLQIYKLGLDCAILTPSLEVKDSRLYTKAATLLVSCLDSGRLDQLWWWIWKM